MGYVEPAPEFSSPLSPSVIEGAIDRVGARDTVVALLSGGEEPDQLWDEFLAGVKAGDQDWLEVAARLAPATDAWTSESLRIALSIALSSNAEGVLRLDQESFPLERLCTNPLIEPSDEAYDALSEAQLRALGAVSDHALIDDAERCRAIILESIGQAAAEGAAFPRSDE